MKISYALVLVLAILHSHAECATVRGRVLDSRSSGPVRGARVVLSGTTLGAGTDAGGAFSIEQVPIGKYIVRVSLAGSGQKDISIAVDSINQIVEMNVLYAVAGRPIVTGCIPEFMKYQSDLAAYLSAHPGAVSFEITEFRTGDSTVPASVIVTVKNDSPHDVYLLKDRDRRRQMYLRILEGGSPRHVPDGSQPAILHELGDVVRVPRMKTVVADTVSLRQYDFSRLTPGEYRLKLVYVFPMSRSLAEDARYPLSSPIENEKGIGELYCMTLQGRFESNWLTVQLK